MLRILRIFSYGIIIFSCLGLLGCGAGSVIPEGGYQNHVDTTNLGDLMNLIQTHGASRKAASTGIRYEAIKETALSVGAQGGLAYRSEIINKILVKQRTSLEKTFDFNGMLLEHNVLPPVLVEGSHILNLSDSDTIRVADKTYSLVSQARFVTTVPLWSDYLWMNFTRPAVPDDTLLPRNDEEKRIWKEYVLIGWKKGIAQADAIYDTNVARLKRDYEGMTLYRKLLVKHMISAPFVARTDLGVTGDGANISVNDHIFRITSKPQLEVNAHNWKPIVQP